MSAPTGHHIDTEMCPGQSYPIIFHDIIDYVPWTCHPPHPCGRLGAQARASQKERVQVDLAGAQFDVEQALPLAPAGFALNSFDQR